MAPRTQVRTTRRLVRAMFCGAAALPLVVGVAWWCAARSPLDADTLIQMGAQPWPVDVPAAWGTCNAVATRGGRGVTEITAETRLSTGFSGAVGAGAPPWRRVMVVGAGWPLPALATWMEWGDDVEMRWRWGVATPDWLLPDERARVPGDPQLHLPLRPMAAGLLLDWVATAVGLWLSASGVSVLTDWWRTRRGRCRDCGHPLAGAARCPECGAVVTRRAAPSG